MRTLTKSAFGIFLAAPVLALAFAGGAHSGLRPGDMVFAFEPTHVTGADAGTHTCPVCKYGAIPAVQVWINGDKMENVSKIADSLEMAVQHQGSDKLKAFMIFIKPSAVSDMQEEGQLKMIADKCHLQNVALLYVNGPKDENVTKYKINTAHSVKNTVLVYHDRKVDSNFVNLQGDEKGLMALKGALMHACGM